MTPGILCSLTRTGGSFFCSDRSGGSVPDPDPDEDEDEDTELVEIEYPAQVELEEPELVEIEYPQSIVSPGPGSLILAHLVRSSFP